MSILELIMNSSKIDENNLNEGILCVWNPKDDRFTRLDELVDEIGKNENGTARGIWGVGNNYKKMRVGRRVFLLRLGVEPKGLVGSGKIVEDGVFRGKHFDPKKAANGAKTNYIRVIWDFLNPDPIVTKDELLNLEIGRESLWKAQGSGVTIDPKTLEQIEALWRDRRKSLKKNSYTHKTWSEMTPTVGVLDVAHEVSNLLTSLSGDTPVLVGIFGKWGRGKTFLFKQIWKDLKEKGKFIKVEFNAWKHQKTPALWGYLYEAVANKYYDSSSSVFNRRLRVIRLNINREGKGELSWFFGSVIVFVFSYFLRDELKQLLDSLTWALFGLFGAIALISLSSFLVKFWERYSKRASTLYKKYSKEVSHSKLLGVQAEVQSDLRLLLKTWLPHPNTNKRILLFVDDIDRCSEDKIIEVVDALRVMLDDPEIAQRIIVALAVDERILQRAISIKYQGLFTNNPEALSKLTKEYFDKLFIAGIRLGSLTQGERKKLVEVLTEGKVEIGFTEDTTKPPTITLPNDLIENSFEDPKTKKAPPDSGDYELENADTAGVLGNRPDISYLEDQTQNTTSINELSQLEFDNLSSAVQRIEGLTPRQIRIFYIRYLLFRDFLKTVKGFKVWTEDDMKITLSILEYLNDKDVIGSSVQKLLKEAIEKEDCDFVTLLETPSKKKFKDHFFQMAELVTPY